MPRVAVHGCEVAFTDSGPQHAPAVVLLHGFLGCKEDWQLVRTALEPRLRVIAVDLPGHGDTHVVRFPEDYSVDGTCALLDGLFDRLALRDTILAGYSMGGRIALAYAVHTPQRLRGLLLESASPGIAGAAERERRRAEDEQRAAALEREGLQAFVEAWERQPLFASQAGVAPELRKIQRDLRLRGDAAAVAASLRAAGTGAQPWLGDHLATLALPVLLVTGSLDSKFETIARQMLAVLPDARWTSAAHTGHNVHLENPQFFADALAAFAEQCPTTNDNQGVRP